MQPFSNRYSGESFAFPLERQAILPKQAADEEICTKESPDDPEDVPDSAVARAVFPEDGLVFKGIGLASGVPPADPAPDPPPDRRPREPSAIGSKPDALRSAPMAVVSASLA